MMSDEAAHATGCPRINFECPELVALPVAGPGGTPGGPRYEPPQGTGACKARGIDRTRTGITAVTGRHVGPLHHNPH